MRRRVPARLFFAVTLLLVLAAAVLSLVQGEAEVPPLDALRAVAAALGLAAPLPDATAQSIVGVVRLPRVAIAVFGGAALAIAGTIMQAVFRNPLASPEILGTAQGAALGATVAVALEVTSAVAMPAFAVVAATVVTLVVYLIAGGIRAFSTTSLLLAGIAMNTLVGALIAFAISYLSDDTWAQSGRILFWLMGNFDKTQAGDVVVVAVGLVGFTGLLLPFLRDVDLMTLEDQGARALGVDVTLVRTVLLVVAAALTAITVAFTGGIAFVGLVVPHMARLIVGPVHRQLLPCAAALGALLLLLSDYVCRVMLPDSGLRVGVVMSLVGAPYFLYLLIRLRRGDRL